MVSTESENVYQIADHVEWIHWSVSDLKGTCLCLQPQTSEPSLEQQSMMAKAGIKEEDEEAELDEGGEKSETETPDSKADSRHDESEEYEQLFAAVMTAREGDRNLSEIFQLLPSRPVSLIMSIIYYRDWNWFEKKWIICVMPCVTSLTLSEKYTPLPQPTCKV